MTSSSIAATALQWCLAIVSLIFPVEANCLPKTVHTTHAEYKEKQERDQGSQNFAKGLASMADEAHQSRTRSGQATPQESPAGN